MLVVYYFFAFFMVSLAIVGRPNVGKSTLFNRLLGKKRAIVHDTPGVTRDWQVYDCKLGGASFQLYDTPGVSEDFSLLSPLGIHIVLWVIDGKLGVTSTDLHLAECLRRQNITALLVVNKCESYHTHVQCISDCAPLGFGEPIFISALHGNGMQALGEAITAQKKALFLESHDKKEEESAVSVMIMGRPNVGKSTFVNRFLGYDRMTTGPQAGITTDAVVNTGMWNETPVHIVDTAGLRRAKKHGDPVELLSCKETYRALVFCHVAVIMIDAAHGLHKQDLVILNQAEEEGRAIVIALNKWDQVAKQKDFLDLLPPLVKKYTVIPLSCVSGEGFSRVWNAVLSTYAQWNERLSTGPLNRWLLQQITANPPPLLRGHRIKIKYMTQAKTRPPTFILFGYRVESLPPAYLRYLSNGLRQNFSFSTLKLECCDTQNPYSR